MSRLAVTDITANKTSDVDVLEIDRPYLGFGLGLRTDHYESIFEDKPKEIEWFEAISENFMVDGGKPLENLDKIRQDYEIVLHGVSMSIAGDHDIDYNYLDKLKKLAERYQPAWVSDHLAWTRGSAHQLHDLLPVPYSEEVLNHVVERVKITQDYLGRPIALENPSTYASFLSSHMTEYEFLNELADRSDCYLILDVNNVFVSCENHGWNADEYINGIKPERVWQHHLAGHTYNETGKIIIDTHDQPVRTEVWDLYKKAVKAYGRVSTMVERDDNIPPLSELVKEISFGRELQAEAIAEMLNK